MPRWSAKGLLHRARSVAALQAEDWARSAGALQAEEGRSQLLGGWRPRPARVILAGSMEAEAPQAEAATEAVAS